jgi:Leucine-rich repeat (LRR) protein
MNNAIDYSDLLETSNKKELHKKLCHHFAYLADLKGFKPVLSKIMKAVDKVGMKENNLVLFFKNKEEKGEEIFKELIAAPPADKSKYKNWPASFQKYVAVHESLVFEYELQLGGWSDFEPEFLSYDESDIYDFVKPEELQAPLTEYADWWLYHPGKINNQKEPSLCFLAHEGGDLDNPVSYSGAALFLKKLANHLDLDIELPEDQVNTEDAAMLLTWWEELSPAWQNALLDNENLEPNTSVDAKTIKAIVKTKSFRYFDREHPLGNLDPLLKVPNLESISLVEQKDISDISILAKLPRLGSMSIKSCPVSDLSALAALTRIGILDFNNLPIEDISPLKKLKKLQRLEIKNTNIVDLSPLKGLTKIVELDISGTPIADIKQLEMFNRLDSLNINNTKVTDLSPLKNYEHLGQLYINDTKISDLSPIKDVKGIFIFHCKNTNINLKELLTFGFHRFEESRKHHVGLMITSDYYNSHSFAGLASVIESIDFPLNELEDVLAAWITPFLLSAAQHKTVENGEKILRAWMKQSPFNLDPKIRLELLSAIVMVLTRMDDKAYAEKVIKEMSPEHFSKAEAPFRLACYYAQNKEREKMLKYSIAALELAQTPASFKKESAFAPYINNEDFIQILAATHSADPTVNPAGWWNPLSGTWRKIVFDAADSIKSREDIKKVLGIEDIHCSEVDTLEPLRYMKSLKNLKISSSTYTSVASISQLKELTQVSFDSYPLTDLEAFKNLPKLKQLNLGNTGLSQTKVDNFKASQPQCELLYTMIEKEK